MISSMPSVSSSAGRRDDSIIGKEVVTGRSESISIPAGLAALAEASDMDDAASSSSRGGEEVEEDDDDDGSDRIVVKELGPDDVLLGRGTGPNDYEGNVRFRALIRDIIKTSDIHDSEDTKAKTKLATKIVETVKARNGRFLQKTTAKRYGGKSTKGFAFVVVPDKVALDKTKQSLRHQLRIMLDPNFKENRDRKLKLKKLREKMLQHQQAAGVMGAGAVTSMSGLHPAALEMMMGRNSSSMDAATRMLSAFHPSAATAGLAGNPLQAAALGHQQHLVRAGTDPLMALMAQRAQNNAAAALQQQQEDAIRQLLVGAGGGVTSAAQQGLLGLSSSSSAGNAHLKDLLLQLGPGASRTSLDQQNSFLLQALREQQQKQQTQHSSSLPAYQVDQLLHSLRQNPTSSASTAMNSAQFRQFQAAAAASPSDTALLDLLIKQRQQGLATGAL